MTPSWWINLNIHRLYRASAGCSCLFQGWQVHVFVQYFGYLSPCQNDHQRALGVSSTHVRLREWEISATGRTGSQLERHMTRMTHGVVLTVFPRPRQARPPSHLAGAVFAHLPTLPHLPTCTNLFSLSCQTIVLILCTHNAIKGIGLNSV